MWKMSRKLATTRAFNLTTQKFKSTIFKIESQNRKNNPHWANSKETMGLNLQFLRIKKIILIIDLLLPMENPDILTT
jgi:hypothetical protein